MRIGRHARLEIIRERLLVQEQPRVLEILVEPVLQPPDAPHRVIDVAIAREHEDDRVRLAFHKGIWMRDVVR